MSATWMPLRRRLAMHSRLASKSGEERRAILHRVADPIESRREEIAFVECMDTGQPLRFMSGAALRGAENFRFFADRAPGAAMACRCPRAST